MDNDLLARIRWVNVAKLAAVIGGVALLAAGLHRSDPPPVPSGEVTGVALPAQVTTSLEPVGRVTEEWAPNASRPKRKRRRRKQSKRPPVVPQPPAATAPVVPDRGTPQPAPRRDPAREFRP